MRPLPACYLHALLGAPLREDYADQPGNRGVAGERAAGYRADISVMDIDPFALAGTDPDGILPG